MSAIPEQAKLAVDGLSIVATLATIAGWLPPIAALLSIVWLSMQIYDWIRKHLTYREQKK